MPRSINKTYLVKLTTYAKEKAHGIGTTILIVFSVLLLLIGKVNETSLSIFKSYFLDITSGFLTILGKPVNSVSDGFYKINDLVYLYTENQDLREENKSLSKWKDLALELLAENEELKKLLNSSKEQNQKFVSSKVITNSGGSYVKTITINVGSNDGVRVGNPVINNWGMIGRIVEIGRNSSRVLLTTDINSQIPVYFENSLHKAILVGKNSDLLELKFLKKRVYLQDEERLMTSGEGGILPRGIPVGLYSVELNKNIEKINVLPAKDWDKLSFLNVILYNYEEELK
jgi:rod shape-determining protein MreC